MHLAFLTNEYPPLPSGGIGTSVQNLGRALVRAGHRVTVLGWRGPQEFEDEGVRIRMLAPTRIPRLGWFLNRHRARRALNELVRADRLALVETHDWCAPSLGMRLDCPLLVRCHGSATYFAALEGSRAPRRVRWAECRALRQAGALAAVSAYAAEHTARLFRLRGEMAIVPNGIDIVRFAAAADRTPAPGMVLYAGTLIRKKGVFDLGAILHHARGRAPAASLRLAGRDSPDARTRSTSTWETLRRQLPDDVRAHVHYLGPQPYAAMPAAVAEAAVCLFPSYAEAFPVSWLEAMACGRPIVGYDFGWAREVLGAEAALPLDSPGPRGGFLVAPGNTAAAGEAVARLLADAGLAAACGAAARRRVETRFTAQRAAERTLAWYTEVLNGRRDER